MKIFGHPWMEHEQFYLVENIEDIKLTPPNALLKIDTFDIDLLKYCHKNSLNYMVKVVTIREAIFANNFQATYLKSSKSLAKELMPIAQNYLFDTQIIASIDNEKEIDEMARFGIDGVWLK